MAKRFEYQETADKILAIIAKYGPQPAHKITRRLSAKHTSEARNAAIQWLLRTKRVVAASVGGKNSGRVGRPGTVYSSGLVAA